MLKSKASLKIMLCGWTYGLCESVALYRYSNHLIFHMFCYRNQHSSKESKEFSKKQNQEDVRAFQDVLQTTLDGTLVVADFIHCVTSTRAWCLFEWDFTIFYHGREALRFVGLTRGEAELGYKKVSVNDAECFRSEDKEMILTEIVKKHGSTSVFNKKIWESLYDVWRDL